MFNVFNRSFKGLNLTPGERAFVKLVEGWLFTAIATGAAIAYQLLATGSQDYQRIGLVAGGAAGLTVLNAFKKYLASQTDLPLPVASLATQATDIAIQKVEQVAQPRFTTPVPQQQFTNTITSSAPQFVQAAPFPYQPSSTYPQMPTVQP